MSNFVKKVGHVIHVVEDASYANFGVSSALLELVEHFPDEYSCVVCAVSNHDKETDPRFGKLFTIQSGVLGKYWKFSSHFDSLLTTLVKQNTLIHIHGIWMAPQYQAAKFAIRHNIPFVITPHNMLGGWLWKSNRLRQLKKSLYWHLILRNTFTRASAIHALTVVERDAISPFFPESEISIIPNGISVNVEAMREGAQLLPQVEGKYLLFLGRLHPVKGLVVLFKALSQIPESLRITLIVAGVGHSSEYENYLKKLVNELELSSCVRFVGLVSGAVKWSYLKHAWALCAPSYSEGMSMVALEGMASGTPLLTTHASGFADLEQNGAGLLSGYDVQGVVGVLQQALSWSEAERMQRGKSALDYVRGKYSWDRVSTLYGQMYSQVLGVK